MNIIMGAKRRRRGDGWGEFQQTVGTDAALALCMRDGPERA